MKSVIMNLCGLVILMMIGTRFLVLSTEGFVIFGVAVVVMIIVGLFGGKFDS